MLGTPHGDRLLQQPVPIHSRLPGKLYNVGRFEDDGRTISACGADDVAGPYLGTSSENDDF